MANIGPPVPYQKSYDCAIIILICKNIRRISVMCKSKSTWEIFEFITAT